METPKMYFICEERGHQWWVCYGFLDTGFCFGEHICSHPGFAPSDLYFGRLERVLAMKELFGREWLKEEASTIVIRKPSDIPQWFKDTNTEESAATRLPLYEKYTEILARLKGEAGSPVVEGSN